MKNINVICYALLMLIAVSCDPTAKSSQVASTSAKIKFLIGTYTDSESEGIYQASFDTLTGEISDLKLLARNHDPSYLVRTADSKIVFAINERQKGSITSYEYAADTLVQLSEKQSQGVHPCYVDIYESSGLAALANYTSGDGAVFQCAEDGEILDTLFTYRHEGHGPNAKRQNSPHAHCAIFRPDGKFIYVVDLGIDQVQVYPTHGIEVGKGKTALTLEPGDGPRHLIFHSNGKYAFLINELSNTILSLSVNEITGQLTQISRLSTLPTDFDGHNQCADIHLSTDGKYLYGSNRGHNSIVIFKVSDKGMLDFVGTHSTHGEWPRNFTISPDDKYVLVANQHTDNITVFKRDVSTGLLEFTNQELIVSKPVCLKF